MTTEQIDKAFSGACSKCRSTLKTRGICPFYSSGCSHDQVCTGFQYMHNGFMFYIVGGIAHMARSGKDGVEILEEIPEEVASRMDSFISLNGVHI